MSLVGLMAVGMLVGCGSGGSASSESKKIDFAEYLFPEKSMKKAFIVQQKFKDSHGMAWGSSIENIEVKGSRIEYLEKNSTFAHSFFDLETNVIYVYYPSLSSYYQIYGDEKQRNIEVGDTIWTKKENICKLDSQIESFHHQYIKFSGVIDNTNIFNTELSSEEKELYTKDILKVKCKNPNFNKNIIYYYFKKGIGRIATIIDNCYDENKVARLDISECSTTDYVYSFYVNDSYLNAMNEGELSKEDTTLN